MPAGAGWREGGLVLLMLAPLVYLLVAAMAAPYRRIQAYHVFADVRTCLGLKNFGNVASNLPFLLVGAAGALWCYRHPGAGAMRSWMVFFLGVALVFFGSAYYHRAPDDDSLVWDRLPMTVAFMGLFAALVSEHMGARLERALLVPAIVVGIASVYWWRYSDDLRVYVWVQFAPLLAIPFVLAAFPGRYTHRLLPPLRPRLLRARQGGRVLRLRVLLAHLERLSGHSLKHLLAAVCAVLRLSHAAPAPARAAASTRSNE